MTVAIMLLIRVESPVHAMEIEFSDGNDHNDGNTHDQREESIAWDGRFGR